MVAILRRPGWLLLQQPEQRDPDRPADDRRIGHVERRPVVVAPVPLDEIDHVPMLQPVDQVAANGSAVRQSLRGVFASHQASTALIATASAANRYCCQPLPSARKLNAAPVL